MGVRLESLPEILEPLLVSNMKLSEMGGVKSDLVSKNQDFVFLCAVYLCISLSTDRTELLLVAYLHSLLPEPVALQFSAFLT